MEEELKKYDIKSFNKLIGSQIYEYGLWKTNKSKYEIKITKSQMKT